MKVLKNKYIKKTNPDMTGTSIYISKEHKAYLEKNRINLSSLVRDIIEDLLKESDKKDNL